MRDGGYYNNWDFSSAQVKTYLKAMQNSSVDVVEIGFRSIPKNSFMGPYIYSLDNYLETLPLPEKALICVMINADEYINSPDKPTRKISGKGKYSVS